MGFTGRRPLVKSYKTDEICSFLLSHTDDILAKWESEIRANIEALNTTEQLALRNSIPDLVCEIAETFRKNKVTSPLSESHRHHGVLRSKLLHYSLAQVMQEYNFLRQCIFDILDAKFSLAAVDRNSILESMGQALSQAVVGFSEERTRSIQREKESTESERNHALKERDKSRHDFSSLETAHEMTNKFVATLSHDLRNPIGNIEMALDLLVEEVPPTRSNLELLELMRRNLRRADAMLRNFLDTQRIKSGHAVPLKIEFSNLGDVVRDVLRDFSPIHGERFEMRGKACVEGYWCAERLKRVIENLLTNAVKYGGGETAITVNLSQDKQHTTLKVHNHGNPISPEEQQSIFQAFIRSKDSDEGTHTGWGLGLAFVKGVAEAHGGSVAVTSGPDTGTTFTLRLPNDARPFQQMESLENQTAV